MNCKKIVENALVLYKEWIILRPNETIVYATPRKFRQLSQRNDNCYLKLFFFTHDAQLFWGNDPENLRITPTLFSQYNVAYLFM